MAVLTQAGVLVPVYRDGRGELRLVVIRRCAHGPHGGQIALPGGRAEPDDADTAATAVRETGEELGLASTAIRLIETLPAVDTLTSGYRIHPYLARIERPAAWRPEPAEVAGVHEPRVTTLAAPGARTHEWLTPVGHDRAHQVACLTSGELLIWGATHRILEPLLPRLLDHPSL